MAKLSKEDWLEYGLKFLAEQGEDAIRIENLCQALKVTKGSFYHHFKNMESYLDELMKFWEKGNTTEIIAHAEEGKGTDEKIKKLNEAVLEKNHLVEVRIRAWAIREPLVDHYVKKIDSRRMDYLFRIYKEKGLTDKMADQLAKIEYAAFVGMQHLFRDLPVKEKNSISELFFKLLKQEIK